jgi:hypothetical protein
MEEMHYMKMWFELRAICSNTMTNSYLSQKDKLIRNHEFNHLTIILKLVVCGVIYPDLWT